MSVNRTTSAAVKSWAWINKEDVKTYKSSCLAHLDMYKLPEKINPSDKDNPYQKKIEITLPELLSVITGKVVENVFYRGAHDKVTMKNISDD